MCTPTTRIGSSRLSPLRALMPLMMLSTLLLITASAVHAIPLSAAVPPAVSTVNVGGGGATTLLCLVDASHRGISSMTAADWSSYAAQCSPQAQSVALDLSGNQLSSLPDDAFEFFIGQTALSFVSLAANRFNGSDQSVGNFFLAEQPSPPTTYVFSIHVRSQLFTLDVSWNDLGSATGGAIPSTFQFVTAANLLMMGCGITTVQPNAFDGGAIAALPGLIDLSFNNLTRGLHPFSFSGVWAIGLSNCNLRSGSLVPGVFDFVGAPTSAQLFLDNLELQSDAGTTLASEYPGRWFMLPLSPRFDLDPLQRVMTGSKLNPLNQSWAFRPPTPAQFAASWANVWDPFPAGVLYSLGDPSLSSPSMRRQYQWSLIVIGSAVSFTPNFLGNLTGLAQSNAVLRLTVVLAPKTAIAAPSPYCPVHSVLTAIARAATVGQLIALPALNIKAYDLPLPGEPDAMCGPLPQCAGCRPILTPGGAMSSVFVTSVSIEPALLQNQLMRFLAQAAVSSLSFAPPPMQLWNAALNQSNWVDPGLFCGTGINPASLTLPALPFDATSPPSVPQFPFAPPAGLVGCLANSTALMILDWLSLTLFPSDLLRGLSSRTVQPLSAVINLHLNLDLLIGTDAPIAPGFFDGIVGLPAFKVVIGCSAGSEEGWRASTCARVAASESTGCAYLVAGMCQPCPLGYAVQSVGTASQWIPFCATCPAGSFCNATAAANPLTATAQLCNAGTASSMDGSAGGCPQCDFGKYQNETGATHCNFCGPGAFSGLDDTTRCLPCAPGTASNSNQTPRACPDCPAGRASGESGLSECPLCPLGSYQILTGRHTCDFCPATTFNDERGGTSSGYCKDCPIGTSSNVPGVAICPACAPGSYQNSTARFACEFCPPGRYGSLIGAISLDNCTACPVNAPASPLGSSSIVQCATGVICEPGLWTAPGSSGVCADACPVGSSCAGGVRSLCAPGSFQDLQQQSACKPCGRGLVGSSLGSTSSAVCEPCPLSTYSSELISASCVPCAAGSATSTGGQTDSSACIALPPCFTPTLLAETSGSSLDSSSMLCPLAFPAGIPFSTLLLGGVQQMHSFLQRTERLLQQANQTALQSNADAATTAALQALAISNAFATYQPLRQSPSLRLAAFGSDSTLEQFAATTSQPGQGSAAQTERSDSSSTLSSASTAALMATLLILAFLPWALYRVLPNRVVTFLDQFNLHHKLREGAVLHKQSTQFGAVVSWSFLCVALLVAILLGTQSNTQTTVKLLPPSASSLAGSAAASWQLTLRVYSGESDAQMALWCAHSAAAAILSKQSGFSAQFNSRAQITAASAAQAGSCDIAADCNGCGISSAAQVSFTLPHSAQLIEWELWVSSAEPESWVRRYGVLTQLPGRLLDSVSELRFSALESFFSDDRSSAFSSDSSSLQLSGFELNFVSLTPIAAQSQADFTTASTVTINFVMHKSDVLLRTSLSDKQSPLQIITLIASAVVSLFSLFAIAFRWIEFHVLKKLGISPGEVKPKADSGSDALDAGSDSAAASASDAAAASSDLNGITLSPLHAHGSAGLEMQSVHSPSASRSAANAWSAGGHAASEEEGRL